MKKAHLTALGKVFASEMDQAMKPAGIPRFPFQSKAKVFKELEALGLVECKSVSLPSRLGLVTIAGWALTPAGHRAYCEACKDEGGAA
jgi:hypothetical protein